MPAYVNFGEGRMVLKTNGTWFAEIYLKDHLGNIRVAFCRENGVIKTRQVNSYYPFGMNIKELSQYSTDNFKPNEYLYNGKMMQDEMGLGWLDYGARFYDAVLARWHSVDKEAEKYESHTPYGYVLNRPTVTIDPDGKRVYFIGGANNDQDGWNYIQRWGQAFKNAGIEDFRRVNMTNGKAGDIEFTTKYRNSSFEMYCSGVNTDNYVAGLAPSPSYKIRPVENEIITKTVAHYKEEIKNSPLKKGEQFNLAGYSYGSVLQAQVALKLANSGQVVDNLILIGSPISDNSELYKQLSENKNIKNIIRYDIKGDHLSNPKDILEYLQGGIQNKSDDGPHFDAARPGKEADKLIQTIIIWLQQQGVKN